MKNRLQVLDAVLDASPLAIVAVEETIGQQVPVDSDLLLNTEGKAEGQVASKGWRAD